VCRRTAAAGQHFEDAFDTIGNRQSSKAGGDNDGANLQSATYAVNTLNQYTNHQPHRAGLRERVGHGQQ
jgi:hypothetical protein